MAVKNTRSLKKRLTGMVRELKITNFLFLTCAGIINAFGVTIFLFPVKLYDSGISGLSMLLDQITPETGFFIYCLFRVYRWNLLAHGLSDNGCSAA